MMNLLILSDSHGSVEAMLRAVRREQPDMVLHLGDVCEDLRGLQARFPDLDCRGVRGNCDGWRRRADAPERLLLTLEGVKLLAVHGHTQCVKEGLERLYFTALEAGAGVTLFGHTHRPYHTVKDGAVFVNPGSIGYGVPPSYAVLTLDNGAVRVRMAELDPQ